MALNRLTLLSAATDAEKAKMLKPVHEQRSNAVRPTRQAGEGVTPWAWNPTARRNPSAIANRATHALGPGVIPLGYKTPDL